MSRLISSRPGRLVSFLFGLCLVLGTGTAAAVERVTYYHNDTLGSPVAATDAGGTLLWREEYQPYGKRIKREAGSQDTTWYTGKQEEAALGLSYFGARWYDPSLGRFTSRDPVGFDAGNPVSFSKYAYANDNPYLYVDPDGNFAFLVPILASVVMEGLNLAYEAHDNIANPCGDCVRSSGFSIPMGGGAGVAAAAAKSARAGTDVFNGISSAAKKGGDFFEGAKYSNKVLREMQQGDLHSFPESVKGFHDAGKVSKLKGGDGIVREKLEIPGGYHGREGKFEFIKEPDGAINHRFFNPNRE